jgi:hypothetical protein
MQLGEHRMLRAEHVLLLAKALDESVARSLVSLAALLERIAVHALGLLDGAGPDLEC